MYTPERTWEKNQNTTGRKCELGRIPISEHAFLSKLTTASLFATRQTRNLFHSCFFLASSHWKFFLPINWFPHISQVKWKWQVEKSIFVGLLSITPLSLGQRTWNPGLLEDDSTSLHLNTRPNSSHSQQQHSRGKLIQFSLSRSSEMLALMLLYSWQMCVWWVCV